MPDFIYLWDQRLRGGACGYRDPATGRVLPNAAVRGALDNYISNAQDTPTALYNLLRGGQISVADWQLQMRDHVKNVHLNAAITAAGGRDQMTQSDWGRVGQLIRTQYDYLDNFATQIANGLPIDGRLLTRSQMYTDAAVGTHETFTRLRMGNSGWDLERSILDPAANHCIGENSCIEQAARDFVPIGELVLIGSRKCMSRCRCTMQYKNSVTGEVVT